MKTYFYFNITVDRKLDVRK